jgi:hypothetical protein
MEIEDLKSWFDGTKEKFVYIGYPPARNKSISETFLKPPVLELQDSDRIYEETLFIWNYLYMELSQVYQLQVRESPADH